MKHIKIILALTITVLGFSLLVFGANEATFQAILDIKTEKANAAKFLVLPELNATDDAAAINMFYAPECPNDLPDGVTCNDTEYDLSGTTIEKLFVIPGKGYIYESKFVGYNAADPIIYMIGVNEAGVITGFHIVYQNDSAGIGAEIANPLFAKQFVGQTLDFAGNGEYVDAVTGSTFPVTLGGMKAGVTKRIGHDPAKPLDRTL